MDIALNDLRIVNAYENVNNIDVFSLRDRISIVSQDNLLFNNTPPSPLTPSVTNIPFTDGGQTIPVG